MRQEWPNWRRFPGVCLEALKKPLKDPNDDDDRSFVLGSKSVFPGEAVLHTQPGISVKITQL
jgi:hypothetical protein